MVLKKSNLSTFSVYPPPPSPQKTGWFQSISSLSLSLSDSISRPIRLKPEERLLRTVLCHPYSEEVVLTEIPLGDPTKLRREIRRDKYYFTTLWDIVSIITKNKVIVDHEKEMLLFTKQVLYIVEQRPK